MVVVAGYIHAITKELGISTGKKLTSKQIFALKNLAIEYKATSVYADIGGKDWDSPIKSSKHLDYLLSYGPMDEDKSVKAWTRHAAEKYLVEIEPILQKAGYKGTIIGSVAKVGFSEHDLDIWLAPIGDKGDFTVVEDEIPMEGMDYIGEDPPHYTILSDGKSVDFHLAEEEGELEERSEK